MNEEFIPGEPFYIAHTLSKDFKYVEIVPLSDAHRGNHLFSPKHFKRTINYIAAEPYRYAVIVGDLNECATKKSKANVYQQRISPQKQKEETIDDLKPIKEKILGAVAGNHELNIYADTGLDIMKDITDALKVPYRAEGLLLKISFGDGNKGVKGRPWTYWIYITHGYGGARTQAAKAVKGERASYFIHADVIIMAHDHVTNVAGTTYLMPDPRTHIDKDTGWRMGSLLAHEKKVVKSNAYIKWGGYAELGGFPPTSMETPIILLTNN